MNIKRIGIDLAKQVFQLHGVDGQDKVVLRKQLRSHVGYAPRTFWRLDSPERFENGTRCVPYVCIPFLEAGLSNYRRCYIPGGSFFFTVVTERRAGVLANERARNCLREAIGYCRDHLPFHVDALVILPDHVHAIWTMPEDDGDYSKRWGIVKKHFTQHWLAANGVEQPITASRVRNRRRGVWQRRFWEHALRDERDYQNHFDYLHYNPVKHRLVNNVADWPYSSFHHWVKHGVYPMHWGSKIEDRFHLENVRDAGE